VPTADLPRLDVVFVKELAFASGLSEATIVRRLHLWEKKTNDPLAIPYLKHLGKPYRIPRWVVSKLLSVEAACA